MTPGPPLLFLGLACALALIYVVLCFRSASLPRTIIKTGSTVALALVAFLLGGPTLLVAALALSALGDAFLALDGEHWLKPGMAAFFLAHVAYVVLFWQLGAGEAGGYYGPLLLALLGSFYLRWLNPSLGDMRLPVLAYGAVIILMGGLALRLLPDAPAIAAGAMMFILSDAILARELFKQPAQASQRVAASILLWLLYFGGQLAILIGVLRATGLGLFAV